MQKKLKELKDFLWKIKHSSLVGRAWFLFWQRARNYPKEHKLFLEKVGYPLDLKNPKSLNQKIVWKKLFDRDPLLVRTSDKYAVRQYVKEVLGSEADEVLVPLIAVVDKAEEIPFDRLPEEFIMKATHASGQNILIEKGQEVNRKKVVQQYKSWLSEPYGFHKQEWAYRKIQPRIVIEELLRGDDGGLAQDYKFHVFHGKCKFIHTTPKINGKRTGERSLFTPSWEQLDVGWKHSKGPNIPPPEGFERMKEIAERLAAPFDYTRVDLYNIAGSIYFGELTHYHGSGMEKFTPQEFDFSFGAFWNLDPEYWKSRA